jgi:hypothetical protein
MVAQQPAEPARPLQAPYMAFCKLFAVHKTHERAKTSSQTDNKKPYNSVYFAYKRRKHKNGATHLPSTERSTEAKQMRFKQTVWDRPARHNLFDWLLSAKSCRTGQHAASGQHPIEYPRQSAHDLI